MKKFNLAMIFLWSVIGLVILSFLIGGVFFNWNIGSDFGANRQNAELAVDESIAAKGLDTVKLDLASDMCRILRADGDDISIKHYVRGIDEEQYAKLSTPKTGTLEVSTRSRSGFQGFQFFSFATHYSMVEVYLPDNYSRALDINISSGTLDIEDALDLSGLDIKVSSGTIRSDGPIKAPEVNVGVSSGTVSFGGGIDAGEYSVKVTSGTVNADELKGSGNIEVSSGTIRLSGVDIKDFLKVKATSGKINIGLAGEPAIKFTGQKTSGTLHTYFETYTTSSADIGNHPIYATVGTEPYKTLDVSVNSGTIRITQD